MSDLEDMDMPALRLLGHAFAQRLAQVGNGTADIKGAFVRSSACAYPGNARLLALRIRDAEDYLRECGRG